MRSDGCKKRVSELKSYERGIWVASNFCLGHTSGVMGAFYELDIPFQTL